MAYYDKFGYHVPEDNNKVDGNVFGPGSSTNNAVPTWSGSSGRYLASSTVSISGGNLTASKLTVPTAAGETIKIGTTGAMTSTADPAYISLGNTYYDGISGYNGYKLKLIDTGSNCCGIGMFANSMIYKVIDPDHWHTFMCGGNTVLQTSRFGTIAQGTLFAPGITTNSGDLSVSAQGSNINFNGKNITSAGAITSTGLTTPAIATSAGDLSITASGSNITFNSKNITNVATANMTNAVVATRQTVQSANYQTTNTTFSSASGTLSDNNTITGFLGEWSPSNWQGFGGIDCSFSGQVFVLARMTTLGTGIRVSKDYGASWGAWLTPTRPTAGVCCDASGSLIYQSSTSTTETGLWRSYDYGATWTQVDPTNRIYSKLRCTADGKKVVGITTNVGLYISENSGASMTAVDGVKNWSSVAMSKDGKKILAAVNSATVPSRISHDGGTTWMDSMTGTYQHCAMSYDGRVMVLCGWGQPMRISRDGGETWATGDTRNWRTLSINADGQVIAASYDKGITLSRDFGHTFTFLNDVLDYVQQIAISGNGRYGVAGDHTALWRSSSPVATALTNYHDTEIGGVLTVGNTAFINRLSATESRAARSYANFIEGTRCQIRGGYIYYLDSFEQTTYKLTTPHIWAQTAGNGTIDFHGANLINCTVPQQPIPFTETMLTLTDTSAGFDGWLDCRLYRVGKMVYVRLHGSVQVKATVPTINNFNSGMVIPVGYRPRKRFRHADYTADEKGVMIVIDRENNSNQSTIFIYRKDTYAYTFTDWVANEKIDFYGLDGMGPEIVMTYLTDD